MRIKLQDKAAESSLVHVRIAEDTLSAESFALALANDVGMLISGRMRIFMQPSGQV